MEECMATSMTEAEYVAMSDTTKETLWLGQLAYTFRQADPNSVPVLFGDNQGVVTLTKNMVHHNASKHIDVGYHFVLVCIISKKLCLEKILAADNVENGMIKCLVRDLFRSPRHHMGVRKHQSDWSGHKDAFGQSALTLSAFDNGHN